MTAPKTNSAAYEVGYGKPPRHTQFRKGQSGNPFGRPPRDPAKRMKALTLQEAYRRTSLKEGRRMMPATVMQAILRSQIELATNGSFQAQRAILAAVQKIEDHNDVEDMLAEIRRGTSRHESGTDARDHEPNAAERDREKRDRPE